ncbi:hypothetical protein EPUL_002394 [Erysiphe pulchra]|uniref:Endonuclease/exonuclease/phosphatase domain-containing protein n=1 Tax=Erysiphe pulchra TaxID=225359 RepID=A0A2S4PNN4_9PEZI|nr:hypothetical protein EPUL_002394 [Erysiphe pulchra]
MAYEAHPMRSHIPFTLMKKVNEVLADPTCVKDAYATSSGVALVAGNVTKVHKILQAKDQLKWITFLVQPVPKRLHSIFGNGFQIDGSVLAEETERITGFRPPNWPRAIRFFSASTTVQKLSIKKPPTQCENCFGFHHNRNCSRIARCVQCSRPRHTGNCSSTCTSHICPPRCINFRGPHKEDYTECPARPTRILGVLTKLNSRQIRAVRTAGGAAWKQAHAAIQNGSDIALPAENLTQAKESRTNDIEVLNDEEEVNVGRGGPAHDIALSLAYDSKADFIAMQEPWVSNNPNRPLTKSHPAFRTFLPKPENGTRPKVTSYVRKSSHIRATQTATGHTRDFFSLNLQLTDHWTTDVWNVYNAPAGSQDAGLGLNTVLALSPPSRTLIVGDFNCRHASWDPSTDRRPPIGDYLEEWAQQHGLQFRTGTPQHLNLFRSEENARSLTQDLSTAVFATALEVKTRSIGAPWWTEECRAAARIFKRARRIGPAYEEQKILRHIVRSAKAAFWKSNVENAKDLSSIYKTIKWHNLIPSYSSPPLQGPNWVASNSSDKVDLLKSTLLDRQLDVEDIPPEVPTVPQRIFEFPEITDLEINNAVCAVPSSSPGKVQVPAKFFRAS